MKTIYLLLITGFVLLAGCGDDILLVPRSTRPLLPPPIDRENYNSVTTVVLDYKKITPGEAIKITGWIDLEMEEMEMNRFRLTDNPNRSFDMFVFISIDIENQDDIDLLKLKFKNSDLTKKCYITGELYIEEFFENDYYTYLRLGVAITNINNVFFE